MLKIKVFGYRAGPQPSATDRIEVALLKLGCEIDDNPDLIIHTTGIFDDAEEFYERCLIKPIRLYNLLDVNNNNPNFYDKATEIYQKCEIATTISHTTKNQIIEKLNINRRIEVIGFPIRPVSFLKNQRGFCGLYVGRWNDPNKRTYLIKPTLELLGRTVENDLVVVGGDKPMFDCFYDGIVEDALLNMLYNGAEFLFLPSKLEGLGLSCLEGLICGAVPLLCNDNVVSKELGLFKDFTSDPNPLAIAQLIKRVQKNTSYYWNKMDELRPIFEKQFSIETVAQNILNLYQDYVREHKT